MSRREQTADEIGFDVERDRIEWAYKSRRVAWTLAIVGFVLALVAMVAAMIAVWVRETPPPVVYWADPGTGAVTVMRPLADGKDKYDETTNKFWLERFIRVCESYDWYTISTDYAACMLMAAPNVQQIYNEKIQGANAPLNTIKDSGRVKVAITSTTFLPDGAAQIRFSTQRTDLRGGALEGALPEKWIATLVYKFDAKRELSEREAMVNPLRFGVWGFRIDPEVTK